MHGDNILTEWLWSWRGTAASTDRCSDDLCYTQSACALKILGVLRWTLVSICSALSCSVCVGDIEALGVNCSVINICRIKQYPYRPCEKEDRTWTLSIHPVCA